MPVEVSRAALCIFLVAAAFTESVSSEECPRNNSCPNLSHDLDLSPLQGYDVIASTS